MKWRPRERCLILRALGNGNVLVLDRKQLSRLVVFLRKQGVDVDA